jgi:diaminopimelate decarboxylase
MLPLPSTFEKRLELFPLTSKIEQDRNGAMLSIAGCDLAELAREYGTPLYLYDNATLDASVEEYRKALNQYYPGSSSITYAGKAFLCTALVQWTQRHDLLLDCTGAGEIAIAVAGGALRQNILVHGVNKSDTDLHSAIELAGTLVVDNLPELERLNQTHSGNRNTFPDLWLRLRPGLAVQTHTYTQTGQVDSKFGMDFIEAAHALEICLRENLPLTGLHFHLGSQFRDPAPIALVLNQVLDFIEELHGRIGWRPVYLCPGGGWGVAYHEDELPHPSIDEYICFIANNLIKGFSERNLPLPNLQLEPGRSLIARAGVALYRVGAVKQTANRRWLLLDGGMADNIRPSLYGVHYTALPIQNPYRPATIPTWLGGPYCESGDVLIENLLLPEVQPGELIAIPVSGAYHLSMSSNYNGALKPAVLWLNNSRASLIQRRQVAGDLLSRDLPLPE